MTYSEHELEFTFAKNPIIRANLIAPSFIESELWAMEILHCGKKIFDFFYSCDLDLDLYIRT